MDRPLLDLYEITVIRLYGAWFAEQPTLNMGARRQQELEETAVTAAAPHIFRYMEESEAEVYAQAPILCKENFDVFIDGLERSDGDSRNVSTLAFESRRGNEHSSVLARL